MKQSPIQNLDEAVVIALGSNMPGDFGSSEALLDAALARLADLGVIVIRRSGWWRSAAWPDPTGPAYTNGVAVVETALDPAPLLSALHDLESEFGRRRDALNASRTLDLDLVAHGRRVGRFGGVELPHPRAAERGFVMKPLAQIAPDWRHPQSGRSARWLAARVSVGRECRLVAGIRPGD